MREDHLSDFPILNKATEAAIINVSSFLGIVPKKSAPGYCATKAALHAFSKSLRYQLENSSIKVFEIITPLVDTDMTRGRPSIPLSGVAKIRHMPDISAFSCLAERAPELKKICELISTKTLRLQI
ncbi:MAG: SDR family NAD(P)-dependent oxidoreductase [Deltaproteobacteria bacterium]|nr:SDR family NAD(P)-dependent oxidoreductase [Deltaproteobacteria bacterium]